MTDTKEEKLKLARRTKTLIRKAINMFDNECGYYEWDVREFNSLQKLIDEMIDLLESSEYIEPSPYNPCPICGGEVELILDADQYRDFDWLTDVFQCNHCKTTFEANQLSDILYLYFKKNK